LNEYTKCYAPHTDARTFPATIFYNEGWLLRIIIDWFSRHRDEEHPLRFTDNARWFSEALLPTQFLARNRRDPLAEGYSHADAVIGNVSIGKAALANAALAEDAEQLVVTEAKLFSRLSSRVTNAAYFDQAARNVACIAQLLCLSKRQPQAMSALGFFVIAPLEQIDRNLFATELAKASIESKVLRRVLDYPSPDRESKEEWMQTWFLPTLSVLRIECISWEMILDWISSRDAVFGLELKNFYQECLRFNRLQEPEVAAPALPN
jgi:hypothetical protein